MLCCSEEEKHGYPRCYYRIGTKVVLDTKKTSQAMLHPQNNSMLSPQRKHLGTIIIFKYSLPPNKGKGNPLTISYEISSVPKKPASPPITNSQSSEKKSQKILANNSTTEHRDSSRDTQQRGMKTSKAVDQADCYKLCSLVTLRNPACATARVISDRFDCAGDIGPTASEGFHRQVCSGTVLLRG